MARLIDTYEPLEEHHTSHSLRFRREAVAARAQFLGYAEDGVTENTADPIERKLASTVRSLEAVLLRYTGAMRA
ncbi:hypothetical protein [Dankookia sp. P2]|uniref:hypothetical protein n=1 Tax=Dankookia sp. P2 TaxID=3423955 RepID=UPI003D66F4E8